MQHGLLSLALVAVACGEGHGTRPDAREGNPMVDAAGMVDATSAIYSLRVVVLRPGGAGTGTISSDPAGINDCADDCTADFPEGTTVRLNASGGTFGGWAGAGCTGLGPCFKVITADEDVEAVFWNVNATGVNRVFTTSRIYSPSLLGGVAAADAACAEEAMAAGYTGNWMAWISSTTSNAIDRLGSGSGWVRPDGLPFAQSQSDLLAGRFLYPAALDERGFLLIEHFLGQTIVTGTMPDGTIDVGGHCSNWTSTTGNYQYGDPFGTAPWWSTAGHWPCDMPGHLLCLQTNNTTAPMNPTAGGGTWRNAFITSVPLQPNIGVAGFDSACTNQAASAGLLGTYKAVIATPTASAASRFNVAGPPWRRRDGAILATTSSHLFDSPWLTSLDVAADGVTRINGLAWTGSGPDLDGPAYDTCQNWSSVSGADHGQAGIAAAGGPWAFSWFYLACDAPHHVYCLQE